MASLCQEHICDYNDPGIQIGRNKLADHSALKPTLLTCHWHNDNGHQNKTKNERTLLFYNLKIK